VTLRRARVADRPALTALLRELLDHHAALLPRVGGAIAESALARALDAASAAVWIAEEGALAIGFCVADFESAPAELDERGRACVSELYVRPGARRRGVGRALADAAFAWARERGAARVEVRVAAGNAEGQAFWRALGFGDFVDVLDRRL